MKKILLINPPLFFDKERPVAIDVSVPPLGLMYLASYINENSKLFEAVIIDMAAEQFILSQLKQEIKKINPFAIGIYAMTPQLQGALELAKYIKANFSSEAEIFLGGPHVSADPGFILRFNEYFDYAICGEAEKTFLESLNKLFRGEKIKKIQKGDPIGNLDELPIPDRRLIKREKYSKYESMMFSRGCPYNCYYCSRPAVDKKIRYRSTKNLLEEIKLIYHYCDGQINFQDDSFTLNKDRVIEFCQAVIREKMKLNWTCNTRIDLVDEDLLNLMKQGGCTLIHFGIESGSEKVRKEIVNKGNFSNKQIREVFSFCHKYGIEIGGYFMIGHPGETKKDVDDTQNLILNSNIDLLGLSIPTPFPGSKLFDIAKKRGIISEKIMDKFAQKSLGIGYSGVYPVLISENLTQEYVYSVMKYINRKFYLNFKMFWNKVKSDIISPDKIKQDVCDLVSLVAKGVSTRKPYVNKKGVKKEK